MHYSVLFYLYSLLICRGTHEISLFPSARGLGHLRGVFRVLRRIPGRRGRNLRGNLLFHKPVEFHPRFKFYSSFKFRYIFKFCDRFHLQFQDKFLFKRRFKFIETGAGFQLF